MNEPLVIIGAGPVGLSLALRLIRSGRAVQVLEAKQQGAYYQDHRALALSQASRLMLQELGVWPLLQRVTPINTIHVSQKGSLGRSLLKASDYDMPALGYVLSYGDLMQAMDQVLAQALAQNPQAEMVYQAAVSHITPNSPLALIKYQQQENTFERYTPLAILADGGRSLGDIPGLERVTKEYGHHALVTKIEAELAHDGVAYERFTAMGPVALLPNGEREFSLVWTGASDKISPLIDLPDDEFLQQLHEHFGDRVGRFVRVEKRMSFPLKLSYLNPTTAEHLVVIGNAAQTMHPVAGQGFNVGLRDAWHLADDILACAEHEVGDSAFMQRYQQGRARDTQRGLKFTDFLVRIFSNDIVGLGGLRSMSLALFDVMTPAKSHLIRKMSFGSKG
jgi:2-octaprenyl-6-methoxyphenol hydroxylase